MTATAPILGRASTASWPGCAPEISVVVATHNRGELLPGLLDALEAQQEAEFEVIVADDGSTDDTWDVLRRRCESMSMRLLALRLEPHGSPILPRNTAASQARAGWLALTDDDCLPTPGWLHAHLAARCRPDVTVLQGKTLPAPGEWGGPWGRSLSVTQLTGLYEAANLACSHDAFDAVGGFPETGRFIGGRPFGEDVMLGHALASRGIAAFVPDALVYHRVFPGSYRQFLGERRRLRGFPALVREIPSLRRHLFGGIFLSRRTAMADLAFVALAGAAVTRRPGLALAALPWTARCWRDAAQRSERPRWLRTGQLAAADLTALAALAHGSVKARRLVL